jgi:hypothetical protein
VASTSSGRARPHRNGAHSRRLGLGRSGEPSRREVTISIAVMDESIGQVPADWRIGVDYEKPLNPIRKWFKPVPVKSLLTVFEELKAVLASESQFRVSETEP